MDVDKLPWGKEEEKKKEEPETKKPVQGKQITMDKAAAEGGFVKIAPSLPCWEWDDDVVLRSYVNQILEELAAAKDQNTCAEALKKLTTEDLKIIGYQVTDGEPYEEGELFGREGTAQYIAGHLHSAAEVKKFLRVLSRGDRWACGLKKEKAA